MNKDVLHKAIDILSRREHSTKELKQKLLQRSYSLTDITPVLNYLEEENYLSDERFADAVFRSRLDKGYGWQYIKAQLFKKGVDSHIVNHIKSTNKIDWYHQAQLAYNKRFGLISAIEEKTKVKHIRFLQQRGFSLDEIMTVLNNQNSEK